MQYNIKLLIGFSLLVALLIPKEGVGQQDPVYNQYINNLLTVQPAYSGMTEHVVLTSLTRLQWIGFDGAPKTESISLQAPIKDYKFSLGISLLIDKFGPVTQRAGFVDYVFNADLNPQLTLSLGIKGSVNWYQAILSDLPVHDPNDPIAIQDITRKFLPNFGFGALLHGEKFFLGFSIPKFIKNKVTSGSEVSVYYEDISYFGMVGGIIGNGDLKFKPTLLYRYSEGSPQSTDISANFLLYDRFWVGASYRLKNSYGILFQVYVDPQKIFKIGYAYDLTTFHPSQVNSGTHELLISVDIFGYNKRCPCKVKYF